MTKGKSVQIYSSLCPRCKSEDISFVYEKVRVKSSYFLFLIFSVFLWGMSLWITATYKDAFFLDRPLNRFYTYLLLQVVYLLLSWLFFYSYKKNYSRYVEDITYAVCNKCGKKSFWEYPAQDERKRKAKKYTPIYMIITTIVTFAVSITTYISIT